MFSLIKQLAAVTRWLRATIEGEAPSRHMKCKLVRNDL